MYDKLGISCHLKKSTYKYKESWTKDQSGRQNSISKESFVRYELQIAVAVDWGINGNLPHTQNKHSLVTDAIVTVYSHCLLRALA